MAEDTRTDLGTKSAEVHTDKPIRNGKHDLVSHRIVVISLALTVLFTGLNMTILQVLGKESPPALTNLGSVAIGALAMTLSNIMRSN